MHDLSADMLSDIVVHMKYAQFLDDENRRETWGEIVDRNVEMHCDKFPGYRKEIEEAFEYVRDKKVAPSMRSSQFAGKPIKQTPNRLYNCAYTPVDSIEAFAETMFLLLGGTGVGYSVQRRHVDQLPAVVGPKDFERRHLVADRIEGWADTIKVLMEAYLKGKPNPKFDFSDIRPKGAELKTAGGKAPGSEPLENCVEKIRNLLESKEKGTKLTPIEVHDIQCFIADAVLSGGIRRAAMISLFDRDDEEMLHCKSGNWFQDTPERARANNSAVLPRGEVSEEEFKEIWEVTENSNSGEPGVYWTNDKDWGVNPCLTKDTWTMTEQGPRKIEDLIGKDHCQIVHGKSYNVDSDGFFKTGDKEVYEVSFKSGRTVKATSDHRFRVVEEQTQKKQYKSWKELEELQEGDMVKVNNLSSEGQYSSWDGPGCFEEGWMIGNLIGDGHFEKKGNVYNTAKLKYWNDEELSNYASRIMKENLEIRSDAIGSHKEYRGNQVSEYGSTDLYALAKEFGVDENSKTVTDRIEKASSEFYRGFLQGIFDADGTVTGNHEKGNSVRIAQVNLETLQGIQRMLHRFGIESVIYEGRYPERKAILPDGQGGEKEYECQEAHELLITCENMFRFHEVIGFRHPERNSRLEEKINSYEKSPDRERFIDQIEEIEFVGEREVFDASVEGVHSFEANGVVVHNCNEAALQPYQFCNLTSVNAHDINTQEELNERAKAAAFIGTLQATYTDFHYLRPRWKKSTEEDALLGVSMTGIASGKVDGLDLQEAAQKVLEINEKYADEFGVNKSARSTLIKPSGTTSLVFGTSSGIHAWHNDYYIRRMRVGKNEEIYKYLKYKTPQLIEDDKEKPEKQAVISIPMRAPEGATIRHETPIEMLERVKTFNEEWIGSGHRRGANTHNVSATVSVKNDEWQDVGDWMWENRESYNGLSVLPYDGGDYDQPPFEDCTREEYRKMLQHVKQIDLREVSEDFDKTSLGETVACGGGECEVEVL